MSRVLPLVGICLSLVALGAAVMPRGDQPPPVRALEPEPHAADEELEYLKRRVELLEEDNRTLWSRVVVLERRPAGATDAGPQVQAEVARLREELRSVMVGEVLSSEAGRSALKEVIRETEVDRQRERLEQLEARRAQQAEAQLAKWKAFAGTAKLTWAQEQKLNERLAFEESERKKRMEQLRLGEQTWQEVNRSLREQRRETDETMTGLLDATQQAQYRDRRAEERGRSSRQRPGDAARTADTTERGARRERP